MLEESDSTTRNGTGILSLLFQCMCQSLSQCMDIMPCTAVHTSAACGLYTVSEEMYSACLSILDASSPKLLNEFG